MIGTTLGGWSSPAQAAITPTVINDPPTGGHSLIVFPRRDFVHGDGWPAGTVLTAELIRNGTVIGTSDPISVIDDPGTPAYDGLFDLNHLGTPCWNTSTPDILPGDVLRVTDQNGVADQTPTANVIVTQAAVATGPGQVTMKGIAADAAGLPMVGGSFEARLVANKLAFDQNGRRTLRASPVFDSKTTTAWTAVWNGLDAHDMDLAVNTAQSRGLWLGRKPGAATFLGSPIESTIDEFGVRGGPAAGCSAPAASYGVTGSTPASLNIATNAGDLTLTGVSQNATAVTVTLTDSAGTAVTNPAPATISAPTAAGSQTWSAVIPASAHNTLLDGTLTASAVYTVPDAAGVPTTVGGASKTLLKDNVAPATPGATPPGGTYQTTQSVTLSSPDALPIFYTVDGTTPTPSSPRYAAQITVSANQTISAIEQDPAGNLSPVATNAYAIVRATAPAAPTVGTATAGNATASLSWTAGADGGSPITGFTVRAFAPGATAPAATAVVGGTATSGTVSGLVNGTSYTLDVLATNAAGTSPASGRSNPVTPATAPGAPAIGTATAGDASATVTWTAPTSDGGSPITEYRVQPYNGTTGAPVGAPRVATPAATSLVVTGLGNGTAYDFDVSAVNALGSTASARSNTVTPVAPVTAPGTPTGVGASAGNASATVSWTTPASNGGSAITGYSVRAFNGAVLVSTTPAAASATSVIVPGLANGTSYVFDVSAANAVGSSAPSAQSAAVTPATTPGAPTGVTATAGNASATVNWSAPASDGGSAITGYSVRVFASSTGAQVGPTSTTPATARSLTVTGLTNGTAYTLDVSATNAVGASVASPSAAVTPVAPSAPGTPTGVVATAGNASATVSWVAPTSNGGSAITSYTVTVYTSTGTVPTRTITGIAPTARYTVVGSLTNGAAVRFRVRAVNAIGAGTDSLFSGTVTPSFFLPLAPGIGTASSGALGDAAVTATASWTAPIGGPTVTSYEVTALLVNADGTVGTRTASALQPSTARSLTMTLPAGSYKFEVRSVSSSGKSTPSAMSNQVTAQ